MNLLNIILNRGLSEEPAERAEPAVQTLTIFSCAVTLVQCWLLLSNPYRTYLWADSGECVFGSGRR